jgi:hypothetical protein
MKINIRTCYYYEVSWYDAAIRIGGKRIGCRTGYVSSEWVYSDSKYFTSII